LSFPLVSHEPTASGILPTVERIDPLAFSEARYDLDFFPSVIVILAIGAATVAHSQDKTITVFAAASLTNALDHVDAKRRNIWRSCAQQRPSQYLKVTVFR
jgi:hypothetical protein